jgi:hypothetical protein
MAHGLCATPTPSLRHSGDREYSRITPPRPSASFPVSSGTWELGAVMGAAPARACREARHVLSRSPPTRSAGYYAGQFLIVHYVILTATPYLCALHAVARPLKSAAVHRYCQHYSLLVRWRIVVGHDTRNGELSLISNLKFQIVPLIRRRAFHRPAGMSISAAVPRGMAGSRVRTVPIQYAPGATARGRWRAANSARLRSRHTPPLDTDSPLAHRTPVRHVVRVAPKRSPSLLSVPFFHVQCRALLPSDRSQLPAERSSCAPSPFS